MEMNNQQWDRIRHFFRHDFHGSLRKGLKYCSLATVHEDGSPHVTPIGSLMVGENKKGIYFEEYSTHMSRNFKHNQRVCVLVVNNSLWTFVKSFLLGKFNTLCAMRLMGTVGAKRKATPQELAGFRKMILPLRWTKGSRMTWNKMGHVREIHFDSFEPVEFGPLPQIPLRELTSL